MDKNGKSRHSVWLSDEVWQEVDAFYKLDNCPTRNEFVEKALRQYCGRLHAERTSAYLPRALPWRIWATMWSVCARRGRTGTMTCGQSGAKRKPRQHKAVGVNSFIQHQLPIQRLLF